MSDWNRAFSAFALSEELLPDGDRCAVTRLYWERALAAIRAGHADLAARCYQHIIAHWEGLIAQGQTGCLAGDAQAFRCNLYRLQANVWRRLAACETARHLLEHHALSLVDVAFAKQPTPHRYPAASQNERNWRILRMYVPWELSAIIGWQARLAPHPAAYEADLYHATVSVAATARLSEIMEEGRQWTANLYTAAAEIQILRCRLNHNRVLQKSICQSAHTYLSWAARARSTEESAPPNPLDEMVLALPALELRYCELVALDAVQRGDGREQMAHILEDIHTLYQLARANPDTGYQLFAARCAWLMGNCAAQQILQDSHAREKARAWYDQALLLLPKAATLVTLYEQAIQADITRLGEVGSSGQQYL